MTWELTSATIRSRHGRVLGRVLLLLLVACGPLGAGARPIRFDHLSPAHGLSQSAVLSIHQDSRGLMWFGTEDGLNRFDGYGFRVYKHDSRDPASLPGNFVFAVAEDARGDLWIGTDGGGVARWERATDRFLPLPAQPAAGEEAAVSKVRTLIVDSGGRVWIGTRDRGLVRFDPETETLTRWRHDVDDDASLSDDRVFALLEDRSGRLWVGTDRGLNRLDPESGAFTRYLAGGDAASLADDQIRSLLEDKAGALWVGTRKGGLHRLDPADGRFTRYRHDPQDPASLANDRVRALFEDADGRLWVGTGGGLDLFDPSRDGFAHYRHDPAVLTSLADDQVLSLFQDRGGVLWIGTQTGGLNKWNPVAWSFGHIAADPSDPEALSASDVTAFSEGRGGRLWIGTFGGGLNVLDRVTGKVHHYRHDPSRPGGLSDDRVMALLHDHRGQLWIGTLAGGLNRFDPASGTFTVFRHDPARPDGLPPEGIMALFEDRQGALWIGTFGGGLVRRDPDDGSFRRFHHDPDDPASLASDRVTALAEAPSGDLWVGTDGGGLDLLERRSGRFAHFRHHPEDPASLASDTVYSLHVDAAGELWVGTRSGLSTVADPAAGSAAFRNFSHRDGLPNDAVYGIRADASGRLWLSSNDGLSCFDPRSGTFTNYDASHGLQADEFHFGSHYRSTSGELFFGGVNGFNAFFPDRLERNGHVAPLVLTSFLKLNRPVAEAGPATEIAALDLHYRDDVVTFEFALLDYTAPEHNRYAYRLEGFDPDWIDLGPIHRVTYTDLDPGRYTFRVRGANNEGVWNEAGLALPVVVATPPWQTPWAYASYLLAVVGVAFAFVRVQQRKVEREAEYSRRLEEEVRQRTGELADRATELEALNQKLVEASLTDSLTGLANRRFLFEYLDKEISLVKRRYAQIRDGSLKEEAFDLVFMMIDLDNFKAVNDTCGHAAGDRVLTQVREVLEGACRSSDILIRWGGDEFLVVGRDSNPEALEHLAERIRARIQDHTFVVGEGQVVRITCCVGYASYPFLHTQIDALSWEQVVSVADHALYVAKKSRRNAWVGFVSTAKTPERGLLRAIREDTDRLVARGQIEVRTSIPADQRVVWRVDSSAA